MPTIGLKQLKVLDIGFNYNLREVPSLDDLPKLEKAFMTYKQHCCPLRYSLQDRQERHDNDIHELRSLKRMVDGLVLNNIFVLFIFSLLILLI